MIRIIQGIKRNSVFMLKKTDRSVNDLKEAISKFSILLVFFKFFEETMLLAPCSFQKVFVFLYLTFATLSSQRDMKVFLPKLSESHFFLARSKSAFLYILKYFKWRTFLITVMP